MITLYAESKCYGNNGQYIARILGKDSKFGFKREFIGRKTDRQTSAVVDEPSLIEVCDIDKKGRKDLHYKLVVALPNDILTALNLGGNNLDGADPDHTAVAIAKRLDTGETIMGMVELAEFSPEDKERAGKVGYRLISKREAEKAARPMMIEAAINICWPVLEALPEGEAKKVIAVLKAKLSQAPQQEAAQEDINVKA